MLKVYNGCSIRTLLLGQLLPEQLSPMKSPRTITHGNFARLTINPEYFHQENPPPDDCPAWYSPWWNCPLSFGSQDILSLNNSPLNDYPRTTSPQWISSRNKWQRTFPLDNCHLIICRWRLKKVQTLD